MENYRNLTAIEGGSLEHYRALVGDQLNVLVTQPNPSHLPNLDN